MPLYCFRALPNTRWLEHLHVGRPQRRSFNIEPLTPGLRSRSACGRLALHQAASHAHTQTPHKYVYSLVEKKRHYSLSSPSRKRSHTRARNTAAAAFRRLTRPCYCFHRCCGTRWSLIERATKATSELISLLLVLAVSSRNLRFDWRFLRMHEILSHPTTHYFTTPETDTEDVWLKRDVGGPSDYWGARTSKETRAVQLALSMRLLPEVPTATSAETPTMIVALIVKVAVVAVADIIIYAVAVAATVVIHEVSVLPAKAAYVSWRNNLDVCLSRWGRIARSGVLVRFVARANGSMPTCLERHTTRERELVARLFCLWCLCDPDHRALFHVPVWSVCS